MSYDLAGFQTSYDMVFFMFNDFTREEIADIGGSVDHHYLNFLFINKN
jgi:hypothetical protein